MLNIYFTGKHKKDDNWIKAKDMLIIFEWIQV